MLLWLTHIADPWVARAAAALTREHIHIGPRVTPLPWRRSTKLARETVSLDPLSQGSMVMGVRRDGALEVGRSG